MTCRWITWWRIGTLVAVAGVAAVNLLHLSRKVPPAPVGVPAATFDPISAIEQRFASVRASLARHGVQGTLGYVGDGPGADDDFYYAQFVFAPLAVDLDPSRHEWAVANFRTSSPETSVPPGWRTVERAGNGVLLLRKSIP